MRKQTTQRDVQAIHGFGGCDREASVRIERDADQRAAGEHQLGIVRRVEAHSIESARARKRLDDEEVTGKVKRKALGPAEAPAAHGGFAVRRDPVHDVVSSERRSRYIQVAVWAEREVKGGDARRQTRERARAARLVDPKDRA